MAMAMTGRGARNRTATRRSERGDIGTHRQTSLRNTAGGEQKDLKIHSLHPHWAQTLQLGLAFLHFKTDPVRMSSHDNHALPVRYELEAEAMESDEEADRIMLVGCTNDKLM